jgi:chromosome segregation ATPase
MSLENKTAEQRFDEAFERLKANNPTLVKKGTPVSQNNVAREAGADPSALRKSRYPKLVREIQAFIEIDSATQALQRERRVARRKKEDLKTQVKRLEAQRDHAQSQLVNAHHTILELLQDNARLEAKIADLQPPPRSLSRHRESMDKQQQKQSKAVTGHGHRASA